MLLFLIRLRTSPPEADKGLIPRPLGRLKSSDCYPVACGGEIHYEQRIYGVAHFFIKVLTIVTDTSIRG
jgi:hypothetical protein